MKVLTIVIAAIFVLLCPIIRLAVCREQPIGEPKIANWQNANSRLAHEWLVGCFTGTVIENSFILFSYRHSAKYSSLFTKSPESPVFIGILRGEEYLGTLHLLFTTLHPLMRINRCARPQGINRYARPQGVPADLQSADKKGSTSLKRICNPPQASLRILHRSF